MELVKTSWVDQPKPALQDVKRGYVVWRSPRPTPGCFLSPGHWKVWIMLAKGKAPKVQIAACLPLAGRKAGAGCRQSRGEMERKLRVTRPVRAYGEKMAVFVLDRRKKPLMPCSEKRARLLLERGRVAVRASGSFNIQSANGLVKGIHHRFCTLIQRADGYGYSLTKIASTQR